MRSSPCGDHVVMHALCSAWQELRVGARPRNRPPITIELRNSIGERARSVSGEVGSFSKDCAGIAAQRPPLLSARSPPAPIDVLASFTLVLGVGNTEMPCPPSWVAGCGSGGIGEETILSQAEMGSGRGPGKKARSHWHAPPGRT